MKKILIVAATIHEIQPFIDYLQKEMTVRKSPLFAHYTFDVLITGVGMVNTAIKLTKTLMNKDFDFALNAGIGGLLPQKVPTTRTPPLYAYEKATVVEVVTERYGDLGVEEGTGAFTDMFELGLLKPNEKPFVEAKLQNIKPLRLDMLPMTHGLTVQKVHGFPLSINGILQKYKDAQIESMEGAAFFQVCLTEGIAFAEIRAISNYVEARNRENWMIPEAVEALNLVLIELFLKRLIR